jgi:hypothetical protein
MMSCDNTNEATNVLNRGDASSRVVTDAKTAIEDCPTQEAYAKWVFAKCGEIHR